MKLNRERDALKGVIDIAQATDKVVKNSLQWSLVYLIFFLALAVPLTIYSIARDSFSFAGLCFGAGVFAALFYIRFIESRGIGFMGKYLDLAKAKNRYDELVSTQGESKATFESPIKFFFVSLFSVGIAYFVMYLLDNYGNT